MKVFGQLEKAQLENTTADVGSLPKGMITYRTDLNIAKVSNGTSMIALIDESSTQTLSGKTYAAPNFTGAFNMAQTTTPANPASGSNKFYFKADGKLYTLDSAGNEAAVGSGAGGGVVNLITNGSADDTAASIFVPYADTGTRPVDGTGGSPTLTTSITTTSPLIGTKSFLLTKPASNTQGQGWAVPFTVALAYRAKVLNISAEYIVNSGTFVPGSSGVDGDLIWYIYDVTNSQLIEPSSIKFLSNSSSISDKFMASFQTSATGSSYRLIAHCASTSALAYEIKLDNVTVSPSNYVYGTPITDWAPYTPSFTGLGTVSVEGFWYRRVGDSGEIKGTAVAGTPTAAILSMTMPPSWNVDPNKNPSTTNTASHGHVYNVSSGTGWASTAGGPFVAFSDTAVNPNLIYVANSTSGSRFDKDLGSDLFGVNHRVRVELAGIPILGFSSSVQMSDSADTRVTAVVLSASEVFAPAIDAKFSTLAASKDTHGGLTANRYNFPSEGFYHISQAVQFGTISTQFRAVEYYFNGVLTRIAGFNGTGATATDISASYTVYAKIGDYLEFGAFQNTGANESLTLRASIQKVSGPQTIAANETYAMRATSASGQTIITGGNTILFPNKQYDTHGSWNGTTFVALTSGKFAISAIIAMNAPNSGASTNNMIIYKNGIDVRAKFYATTYISGAPYSYEIDDVIDLKAGDTIQIIFVNGHGTATSMSVTSYHNVLSITRVGQ